MRIAICSFFQETNSFSPVKTGAETLRQGGLLTGQVLEEKFAGTESEVGGALDLLRQTGAQVHLLPSLWLMPGGPLTREALALFDTEFQSALIHLSEKPDAFFLSLHGCLAAEDEPDATGWFLERLRALAPGVPIAASADFHANVTDRMLRNSDMIAGYRTYPHTDLRETGRRAAESLKRLVAEGPRPGSPLKKESAIALAEGQNPNGEDICDRSRGLITRATLFQRAASRVTARLPLIVPTETSQSSIAPMRGVFERLAAVERETGWPASCFCPHPWLDAPEFAVTLLAYAPEARRAQAERMLTQAARGFWDAREALYRPMPNLEAAWRQVEASAARPVVLVDSGDVVLAGAPGDSTAILRFLSESDTQERCLLHVTDPAAVARLWSAPRDSETRAKIGAHWGARFYPPVEISFRIEAASDAPYTATGDYLGGVRVEAGRRLALRWKRHTLVLAEKPDPAGDPAFFRSLGVEPMEYDVIVVKSHNTFRPAYRAISETIIRAATPGATSPDLRALPYRAEMRRLYPLAEPNVQTGKREI